MGKFKEICYKQPVFEHQIETKIMLKTSQFNEKILEPWKADTTKIISGKTETTFYWQLKGMDMNFFQDGDET